MAMRRKLKFLQEKKKRHFLVFWPDEDCYSEVPLSKMLESKEPSVGQTVRVKEGCKTFTGIIDTVGSKSEVEKRLSDLMADDDSDEEPVKSKPKPVQSPDKEATDESPADKEPTDESPDGEPTDGKEKTAVAPNSETNKKKQGKKRPRGTGSKNPPRKKQKTEGKIIQIDSHDKLPPEMPPTTVSSPRLQNDEPEDAHVSRLQNDDPSLYSISTVSSLPSPIAHDRLSVNVEHQNSTVDSLTLEIEVQELTNRVTTLESGNSHLTDLYKSILEKQDEILSRLASLEKNFQQQQHHHPPPPPVHPPPFHPPPTSTINHQDYSFDESSSFYKSRSDRPPPIHPPPTSTINHQDYSFDDNSSFFKSRSDRPPPYIPPPPSHKPPCVLNEFRSRHPRIPFRDITQVPPTQANNVRDEGASKSRDSSLRKSGPGSLPSDAIDKSKLIPVSTVIHKYPNLLCDSKVGTLAVKMAKHSFFGEDVMVQCTVAGERDLPALPTEELRKLKDSLFMRFPQYWQSPHEFELLWRNSTAAIGQACKRLRSKR